jgi:Glycosyltransferase family 10 (fucosyltransferase) C-term
MLKVRLLGATRPENWSDPRIDFDHTISKGQCDGVLCWGAITDEFLSYRGPRAWYFAEPRSFSASRSRLFRTALQSLQESEFFHHSNPNPRFRLPCATHYSPLTIAAPQKRKKAAVAVVSNYGGRLWWLRQGARRRNAFALHRTVELFGNAQSWQRFRCWPWSFPRCPLNYRGAWPGNWYLELHMNMIAKYQINVCLENSFEPHYFTEKFVNAARAGCVPIYHAHPTVRDSVLRGAVWIDPTEYSFDADATLNAAYKCDAAAIREQNYKWLRSDAVSETDGYADRCIIPERND